MDISEIKKGDVLAYKGYLPHSQIIKSIIKSDYSHVCLYIGNGKLVEADYSGIEYANIDKYKGRLDIYTCDLTDSQRKQICDYAISRIGQKYDYLLLFFLFLRKLFKLRFRFKDRKADICSELVNDSYKEANVILSRKKYPSPQEVVESKSLKFSGSI